jgi:hypothetical protein
MPELVVMGISVSWTRGKLMSRSRPAEKVVKSFRLGDISVINYLLGQFDAD